MRMPKHSAIQIMHSLGRLDNVFEIIDLNKDNLEAKKNYSLMIKRCDEMELKINSFISYCDKFVLRNKGFLNYDEFMLHLVDLESKTKSNKEFFDSIENEIYKDEKISLDLYSTYISLYENILILREKKAVFTKIYEMINLPGYSNSMINNDM